MAPPPSALVHPVDEVPPARQLAAFGLQHVLAMYAGGAMLSAVQLLAGMHAAGESLRGGGTPYAFARQFFLPIEHLLTLFAPRVFGDAVNTVYVGRWFPWETSIFLGVTTIVLATRHST